MRAPVNQDSEPPIEYTLMPTHMRHPFDVQELQELTLSEPFSFSKGCRLLRIPAAGGMPGGEPMEKPKDNLLFDLQQDPAQEHPLNDEKIEGRMVQQLIRLMKENDAPPELFRRLDIAE
jgi:hypothetical protein